MKSIADIADTYQPHARVGRGAGARRGEWALRIVESGDGWLELDVVARLVEASEAAYASALGCLRPRR